MAIIIRGISTLVQNVQSIQGISQVANGYYFLQATLNTVAKVFHLSRFGDYVSAYKFEHVPLINAISFSHRILLLFFNIHRPKSLQGFLKLAESMGVELFFLVRSYSRWNEMRRNTIGDLLVGIPCLLDGLYNIGGEKTIYERTIGSIKTVRDRVLLLEVQVENSRDLQRLQHNLRDIEEIDHFHEELKERSEMLINPAAINAEIVELSWLKTIVTGTENNILREEGDLIEKQHKPPGRVPQRELENIPFRLVAIGAAKELVKADSRKQKLIALKEKIVEKVADLKTKEKTHRNVKTEEAKEDVKKCRNDLKMLQFVADPIALDEELSNLAKLKDGYNSKLARKQTMISTLTSYIEDTFILLAERTKVNEHLISLKKKQQDNAGAMLADRDIANLRIGKEIEPKFNAAFDVHLLEDIALKLINCDQFVRCLKGATQPKGTLHSEFDAWFADATAKVNWNWRKVEGKPIDPSKKIQKKDLYTAIMIEIESMNQMLEMFEDKVVAQHPKFIEEYKDFKAQVRDYFSAVERVFNHENDDDRDPKFDAAKLVNIQPSLLALRRAFQREHDELLVKLKEAQDILEEPHALQSLLERYGRPWSKICFGVSILAVRFFKSNNLLIAPRSHYDLWCDIFFMVTLALSQIVPLFFQNKALRSREIIILREKDIQPSENILDIWRTKIASSVGFLKFLKPPAT